MNGGWCFSISQRKFVLHPIKKTEIGRESPRAYIDYEHTKTPDPGYFKQILQNSLNKEEMAYFCEYYIRLLNFGTKQHKERVMCLVGEPNSGKTSLFTPITRFIPARYIAMISKQKAFNKSLVDENTQIVFLDEAYTRLMEPDDWKLLTQGGLTAHDRKYKTSSLAVIRCPMFITCQTDMDFGREHNDAMAVRLKKFFKRLTSPRVAGVQEFLQTNAMDCVVWACSLAITPDDELPPPMPGTSVQQGDIGGEENERIRNMQLDESESEQEGSEPTDTVIEDSSVEGESDVSNPDSTYLDPWEENLKNIARLQEHEPCHSLKQRQLCLLAAEVKRTVDERERQEERARLRVLEETKERWISLGMLKEEDAHLLQSVNGPYHPNIERSRDQYFARKKQEDQRMLEKKAREYFNNGLIMEKERELRDLQRKEDAATDEDVKRALQYMLEVTVEALKLKFQKEAAHGLAKLVLLERRKKAVEMKWVSPSQAERINSIWCPLLYPSKEMEDDDEVDLFMTPSTAPKAHGCSSSQKRKSQKRRSQQTRTSVPKRGRITHFFTSSQQ